MYISSITNHFTHLIPKNYLPFENKIYKIAAAVFVAMSAFMVPVAIGLYECLRTKQVVNLHERKEAILQRRDKTLLSPLSLFRVGLRELKHRTYTIETASADTVVQIPLQSLPSHQLMILASREAVVNSLNNAQIIYLLKNKEIDKSIIFSFLDYDRLTALLKEIMESSEQDTQEILKTLTSSEMLQCIAHLTDDEGNNKFFSLLSETQHMQLIVDLEDDEVHCFINSIDPHALARMIISISDKINGDDPVTLSLDGDTHFDKNHFFISRLWSLLTTPRESLYSIPIVFDLLVALLKMKRGAPVDFKYLFRDKQFTAPFLNTLKGNELENLMDIMDEKTNFLIFQSLSSIHFQSLSKFRLKEIMSYCNRIVFNLSGRRQFNRLKEWICSIQESFKSIPFSRLIEILYLKYNLEKHGDGFEFDPFTILFLSKEQLQQLDLKEVLFSQTPLEWLEDLAEILAQLPLEYRQSLLNLPPLQLKYLYDSAQDTYQTNLALVNRNPYLAPFMTQPQYFSDTLAETDEEIIKKTRAFQTKYKDVDGLCANLIGPENFKTFKSNYPNPANSQVAHKA